MNSITIRDENSGQERTVYVHQGVAEIAAAASQASQAITYQQQAYIVRHPEWGLFLCIQEGAGSRYHRIDIKEHQLYVDGPGTQAMTDFFRYTGKPFSKQAPHVPAAFNVFRKLSA